MDVIWMAVLAYILNGEPQFEQRVVKSEADCIALNKGAEEIMKKNPEFTTYGSACVKIELTTKEAPKDPFKKK
jgi:hypothetical protein